MLKNRNIAILFFTLVVVMLIGFVASVFYLSSKAGIVKSLVGVDGGFPFFVGRYNELP